MDPNALLTAALASARLVLANDDPGGMHAENLAAAFTDLDQWLRHGGFLPELWERKES